DIVALDKADHRQATLGWIDRYMNRLTLVFRGDGQYDNQVRRAMIEFIHGEHEGWTDSRLLAAHRWIEIDRPDIAPAGFRRAHSSSSPSARALSQSARSACSTFHALGSLR